VKAPGVAKELGLKEASREGDHIDRSEGVSCPRACQMDRLSQELLSRPALSGDQDRDIASRMELGFL